MDARPLPPEFCSAPWKVLHVSPQGEVHSCYESIESLGSLREKSLTEIWNGEKFVALRQKMLSGERVSACEKCHAKEGALEGRSLRTQLTSLLGGEEPLRETYARGEVRPEFEPEVLDLAFSNNCNLKCRMCSSTYSRAWMDDEFALHGRSFGRAADLGEEKLREEIFPLLPNIKRIIIAGGEPLLDKKNKILLRRLIEIGRGDVVLHYNTNGTSFDDETFELWRSFPNLRLLLSLDSSGGRFEYLRKGAKWSRIVENVAKIRAKAPQAELECFSTVTIFNVITHPDFVREIVSQGLFRLTELNLHYLTYPSHYSIQALPPRTKAEIEKKYYEFIRGWLLLENDFEEAKRLILLFKMVLNYMSAGRAAEMTDFKTAVGKVDLIRGESFEKTFPELAQL